MGISISKHFILLNPPLTRDEAEGTLISSAKNFLTTFYERLSHHATNSFARHISFV